MKVEVSFMEFQKFVDKFVLRLDKGEEVVETLKQFCSDNNIKLGSVNGIGSTNMAIIGLFDTKSKEYSSIELKGDHEIDQLSGNISTMNSDVYIHLHANLSDSSYHVYGGHLNSAIVSATCEIIVESIAGEVDREFSDEIGLNLLTYSK